jgi:hypothetical protein
MKRALAGRVVGVWRTLGTRDGACFTVRVCVNRAGAKRRANGKRQGHVFGSCLRKHDAGT